MSILTLMLARVHPHFFSRESVWTLPVLGIVLLLIGGWFLYRAIWRKRHEEVVTGTVLHSRETSPRSTYSLEIRFTDADGYEETATLTTSDTTTASSKEVWLSVIPASVRYGKRWQTNLLDESAYLNMSEETLALAQKAEYRAALQAFQEEVNTFRGRLLWLLHPEYSAKRVQFAEKRARTRPRSFMHLLEILLGIVVFGMVIAIAAMYYLDTLT